MIIDGPLSRLNYNPKLTGAPSSYAPVSPLACAGILTLNKYSVQSTVYILAIAPAIVIDAGASLRGIEIQAPGMEHILI